jgi:hypothetical protein
MRGHLGCDRMVVGFTTTHAISVYHHWCCEFESRSGRGVKQYVIKFVSDLWQVCVCFRVLWFSPDHPVFSSNKTDHHNITEILLKVTLSTIKQTKQTNYKLPINYILYLDYGFPCLVRNHTDIIITKAWTIWNHMTSENHMIIQYIITWPVNITWLYSIKSHDQWISHD